MQELLSRWTEAYHAGRSADPATENGALAIDLASARLNDSWLTVNPAPVLGADASDGRIDVVSPVSATSAPALSMKRPAKGFVLGRAADQQWLNKWVGEQPKTAKYNDWAIHAKPPTLH